MPSFTDAESVSYFDEK